MIVRFIKGAAGRDRVICVRADGSESSIEPAKATLLPPPAYHLIVESTLAWPDGVFGTVARGASFRTAAKAAVARKSGPRPSIQIRQSDALAECLQSEQWAGSSDLAQFTAKLAAASRHRGVRPPLVSAEELQRLRVALREFGAAWRPLPPGGELVREFPPARRA